MWELPSLSHIGYLQGMVHTDKDILYLILACSIYYYFMYFIGSILNTTGRKYLKDSYILLFNRARARAHTHTHTHTHTHIYKCINNSLMLSLKLFANTDNVGYLFSDYRDDLQDTARIPRHM